ncbi:MAG: PIG-L family deacetylase [Patescibacteria group bacterium]|nr:PIG-L family deacetylase [Patescibacteria group bacterium]
MKRKTILAIGAHPDDIDSAAAGSVAKWVEEGATAFYVIATDGGKGTEDPDMTVDELIRTRKQEQQQAAKIIGVKEVFFLNFPDAELVGDMRLKEAIVRYIRMLKPDTVITLSPELYFKSSPEDDGYVNHTDHRILATAVMDCVFPLSRDRLSFPQLQAEGLFPHKTSELLMLNSKEPSFLVDISATFKRKIQAMGCFKSQFGEQKDFPWISESNRHWGEQLGVKYAENFTRLGFW